MAVTGPGGLGKTALCAALVKGLEAEPAGEGRALLHAGLFAHDFYKRPSLTDFVSGILEQPGLVCEEATHQPALAALVVRRPGVMLYIEGAEKLMEAAALLEFLDDRTHLLLTTRDPRQAETLAEHPLEPLEFCDAADAIHYYAASKPRRKRAGPWPHDLTKPGWELLARDLGGHPPRRGTVRRPHAQSRRPARSVRRAGPATASRRRQQKEPPPRFSHALCHPGSCISSFWLLVSSFPLTSRTRNPRAVFAGAS